MTTQLDLFGAPAAKPVAPPPPKAAQSPADKLPEDAELDAALETLSQFSIEWIICRTISLRAAMLLLTLRYIPREFGRNQVRDFGEPFQELKKAGAIRVRRDDKRVIASLVRERIIELAHETDSRLAKWKAGELGMAA
jgi:hypothetical protein